jgi:BA14K-like protein
MNAFRALIILAVGVLTMTPALADKPAYCAAYARDFADARAKDKVLWQHKYDIALQSCIGEPKQVEASVPVAPKKVVVAKAVELVPDPAPAPKKVAMVAGSDDWNIYCANKYTSFNPKTGTYMSKTGVERRCVVSTN